MRFGRDASPEGFRTLEQLIFGGFNPVVERVKAASRGASPGAREKNKNGSSRSRERIGGALGPSSFGAGQSQSDSQSSASRKLLEQAQHVIDRTDLEYSKFLQEMGAFAIALPGEAGHHHGHSVQGHGHGHAHKHGNHALGDWGANDDHVAG